MINGKWLIFDVNYRTNSWLIFSPIKAYFVNLEMPMEWHNFLMISIERSTICLIHGRD